MGYLAVNVDFEATINYIIYGLELSVGISLFYINRDFFFLKQEYKWKISGLSTV